MEENKNNALEKAENIANGNTDVKAEKKERKQIKKEERARLKMARKREKERIKREKKEMKEREVGNGGEKNKKRKYIAAIVTLSVIAVGLATACSLIYFLPTEEEKLLETSYKKSFYDTVEQVDNIDLNLSKALATKDVSAFSNYMLDTAVQSELCENDIQELPLKDESKFYTTKLINQIGDYAKYLNKKIANGETVTAEERESLKNLYLANAKLKDALMRVMENMGDDYDFMEISEEGDIISIGFTELQNLSAEFPELIYDGPFSDGLDDREVKGISGEEISAAEAKDIFSKIFAEYTLSDVTNEGFTDGIIECFNVVGQKDGELFAQISKIGGKLIAFSYGGSCKETVYGYDSAEESASNFIESLGLTNMKPVWYNLSNNVYTFNYVYEQSGIILYPDMVKVRVCAETATVIGYEASGYYINHTERTIPSASISESTAKGNLSENISVDTVRLVVVPIGNKSEKLCYEFCGTLDESTYYVYIDATNGKQVQMFKVIESGEGTLLM